ncbi:hypothetical protein D030_3768A, partial [Vibrio parahaemolyticus AQ3810]
MFALL